MKILEEKMGSYDCLLGKSLCTDLDKKPNKLDEGCSKSE